MIRRDTAKLLDKIGAWLLRIEYRLMGPWISSWLCDYCMPHNTENVNFINTTVTTATTAADANLPLSTNDLATHLMKRKKEKIIVDRLSHHARNHNLIAILNKLKIKFLICINTHFYHVEDHIRTLVYSSNISEF